mmetsp:Transcript_8036/g.22910  ORF Transcript_8036/g.22910 Transcript_8036/m.22910 type:complete len:232 (-) Transcript_8036:1381-2076(-)
MWCRTAMRPRPPTVAVCATMPGLRSGTSPPPRHASGCRSHGPGLRSHRPCALSARCPAASGGTQTAEPRCWRGEVAAHAERLRPCRPPRRKLPTACCWQGRRSDTLVAASRTHQGQPAADKAEPLGQRGRRHGSRRGHSSSSASATAQRRGETVPPCAARRWRRKQGDARPLTPPTANPPPGPSATKPLASTPPRGRAVRPASIGGQHGGAGRAARARLARRADVCSRGTP